MVEPAERGRMELRCLLTGGPAGAQRHLVLAPQENPEERMNSEFSFSTTVGASTLGPLYVPMIDQSIQRPLDRFLLQAGCSLDKALRERERPGQKHSCRTQKKLGLLGQQIHLPLECLVHLFVIGQELIKGLAGVPQVLVLIVLLFQAKAARAERQQWRPVPCCSGHRPAEIHAFRAVIVHASLHEKQVECGLGREVGYRYVGLRRSEAEITADRFNRSYLGYLEDGRAALM